MSVTSILELEFKPESVDEALALLKRILVDTRAREGSEGVDVIQDHTNPAHILVIEKWASLEADTAYRAWRAADGAIPELPPLLAGAPRLAICLSIDV